MRALLRNLLLLALLGLCAGLLLAKLGRVPVAASAGHWPPTQWFLHFTMREAVQTQARGIDTPPLHDARLLRRGAGLYAFGCASCHGAPGLRPALAASLMIPPAPTLTQAPDQWRPRELFWIVKNGIKYTAMPAWAASSRSDEVWAVVAFLQQLPRLDAAAYHALAYGGSPTELEGPLVARTRARGLAPCLPCHGADGGGRDGTAPALAGQHAHYLEATLRDYAEGRRHSGIMQPMAASLDPRELAPLAQAFAAMPASGSRAPSSTRDPDRNAAIARGERIVREGLPSQRVAPCAACHGADGTPPHRRHPVLHGQQADYLALQLQLYLDGTRAHTPDALLMRGALGALDPRQARDVSLYYEAAYEAARRPAR